MSTAIANAEHVTQGTAVHATATFKDRAGTAKDPTEVAVLVMKPDRTVITTEVAVRESTGYYYVEFLPDAPGTWWVRWQGTGSVQAAGEMAFVVDPSGFPS